MGPRTNVFLLAENRLLREALARILGKRPDVEVVGAGSPSDFSFKEISAAGSEILLLDSLTSGLPEFHVVRSALRALPALRVLLVGMDEDEGLFLEAVRAGAAGYLLKDASAMEVVASVRALAGDEAVCPPRLCRLLFRYVAKEKERGELPNARIRVQLGLTRRQQQLVPLLAQGLTNKEIAAHLNLSEQTIKNHVHRMLERVGADDRLAIVAMVRDQGAYV